MLQVEIKCFTLTRTKKNPKIQFYSITLASFSILLKNNYFIV
jgi:hypothetical protein